MQKVCSRLRLTLPLDARRQDASYQLAVGVWVSVGCAASGVRGRSRSSTCEEWRLNDLLFHQLSCNISDSLVICFFWQLFLLFRTMFLQTNNKMLISDQKSNSNQIFSLQDWNKRSFSLVKYQAFNWLNENFLLVKRSIGTWWHLGNDYEISEIKAM